MQRRIAEPKLAGLFRKGASDAVVRKRFERETSNILHGWVRRRREFAKAKSTDAFVEDPYDWMVRYTYRLVRNLISMGHAGILPALVADIPVRHGGRIGIEERPFNQALLAMFWWNPEHTADELLTRQRRSELGDALEYAYRHRVPAKHVNGFIKQAGIKNIPKKLRGSFWEPGFEGAAAKGKPSPR